jgi:hypothetical protein
MPSWSARSSSDFGYEPAIPQCPNLHVVVVVADYGVSAVECLLPRVVWMRCSVAVQPQPLVRNHPRVRRTSASATAVAGRPPERREPVPHRQARSTATGPVSGPANRLCQKLIRHGDVLLAVQESGEGRSLAAARGPIRSAGAQVLPIAAADRRRSRCASRVSGPDRGLGGRDERGRRRRDGAGHGAGHRLPKLAATARRLLNSIPGSVCRGDGRVGDGGRRA